MIVELERMKGGVIKQGSGGGGALYYSSSSHGSTLGNSVVVGRRRRLRHVVCAGAAWTYGVYAWSTIGYCCVWLSQPSGRHIPRPRPLRPDPKHPYN